jgi:hypothetical protein
MKNYLEVVALQIDYLDQTNKDLYIYISVPSANNLQSSEPSGSHRLLAPL